MTNFNEDLLNEINYLREQPRHYCETIRKIKRDMDDYQQTTSIFFKEGKMCFPTKDISDLFNKLEKSKVLKRLILDPFLNKVCEKIFNTKIKPLKNYNTVDNDVYKHIDQCLAEFGKPAGKMAFLLDIGNVNPRPIVMNNLVTNANFLKKDFQLMGVYQEGKITVIILLRYFVLHCQSIDHVSDDCIEIEEEVVEEIKYIDNKLIEDDDLDVRKDFGPMVEKVERTCKIEEEGKDIYKTIYIKKYLTNGKIERDVVKFKMNQ